MSTEVVNAVVAIAYGKSTAATLTKPHEYISLYVQSSVQAAIGSIWQIVADTADADVILGAGTLDQASALGRIVVKNLPGKLAVCRVDVISPNGPVAGVKVSLIGTDPTDSLAAVESDGTVTLDNTEQTVCTIAGGFTALSAFVDPTLTGANAIGSVWRTYAVENGVRTLLSQYVITDATQTQNVVPDTAVPPFAGDSFILTAQQLVGAATAVCSASMIGGTSAGNPAGGAITLAGDTVGPSNANTLQSVTGGNGAAGRVQMKAGAYFSWAPNAAGEPLAGDLRWGDLQSVARVLLRGRNTANTVDLEVCGTDGLGNIFFAASGWSTAQLGGPSISSASIACTQGSVLASASSSSLLLFVLPALKTQSVAGPFSFDSIDGALTGWKFKINGTELGQFTTTKWNPEKGQRSAVTVVVDANYSILQTDYTVALADTPTASRTFTLPAISASVAGDEYETSAGALAGFPLNIAPTGTDKINGVNAPFVLGADNSSARFKLISATIGWRSL